MSKNRDLQCARTFILFLLVCLSNGLTAKAESDSCAALASAKSFSFFTRVATGTVVSGRRAFSQVLRGGHPVACFKEVIRRGNNQAKMYAMAGLRELDRRQFDLEMERWGGRSFTVVVIATVQQGIIGSERSDIILKQIRAGDYHRAVQFCRDREVQRD
jgi:hypothetical protein